MMRSDLRLARDCDEAAAAGIHGDFALTASSNEIRGVVEVTVMVVTSPDAQRWVDEQIGDGLVELTSAMEPVE